MIPSLARSHPTRALTPIDLALVGVAILGLALRFDGLDRRPVWHDETATLLHLSGASEADLLARYDGSAQSPASLLAFFQEPMSSRASLGASTGTRFERDRVAEALWRVSVP